MKLEIQKHLQENGGDFAALEKQYGITAKFNLEFPEQVQLKY